MRLGPQVDFVDDGADLPLALACSRHVALGKFCLLVPRKPKTGSRIHVGLACGTAIPNIYSMSTAQAHTTRIRAFIARAQARACTHARLTDMLFFVLFLVGQGLPSCRCREGARAQLLPSFRVPAGRQAPSLHPFLPVAKPEQPYLAHCTMIKTLRAPQRSPLMVFLSAHAYCTRTPRAPQRPTNNTTKLCHPELCNASLVFCNSLGRLPIRRLYLAWTIYGSGQF